MNIFKKIVLQFLVLFVFNNCLVYSVELESQKLKIVTTTTHISSIVSQIGKGKVEVVNLIPSSMCPGHYDIDPDTVKSLIKASIFLKHNWEKWPDKFLSELNNKNLYIRDVTTSGNWMVPEVNMKAAIEICDILCSIDKINSEFYNKNLKIYLKDIKRESKKILSNFNKYKGKKVISSQHQKDLLEWLGLKVLSTYSRQEDINIKDIIDNIKIGKNENIFVIVDNLQSGPKIGLRIAEELKINHVVLTNFPENDSYLKTLKKNIDLLEKSIKCQIL